MLMATKYTEEEQKLLMLNTLTVSAVPRKGELIPAKLTKIIDGDTVICVILLGNHPLQIKVRFAGLDAPETKLRAGVSAKEKEAGLKVKRYVCSIFNRTDIIRIMLLDIDKYGGRYVGLISHPVYNKTLNDHLVEMKYAKVYDGGKKSAWTEVELDHIIRSIKL